MTLALTLGMSIGLRKTLYMMVGELIGVALVSVLSVIGVASVMLTYPNIFLFLKYIGGAYLVYLGIELWRSRGKLAITETSDNLEAITPTQLAGQGFIAAIANPKGWAFMVSLLPPFINPKLPLAPQLSLLVAIIIITEFVFLLIYATGGKTLGRVIGQSSNVRIANRIAGSLMMLVGLWLALG